jgi:hypothetical protein
MQGCLRHAGSTKSNRDNQLANSALVQGIAAGWSQYRPLYRLDRNVRPVAAELGSLRIPVTIRFRQRVLFQKFLSRRLRAGSAVGKENSPAPRRDRRAGLQLPPLGMLSILASEEGMPADDDLRRLSCRQGTENNIDRPCPQLWESLRIVAVVAILRVLPTSAYPTGRTGPILRAAGPAPRTRVGLLAGLPP